MGLKFNPFTGTLDLVGTTQGFVSGPSSSTDNAVARWDGVTGTLIKDSKASLQDSGALEAQAFITKRNVTGTVVVNSGETWIAPSLNLVPGGLIVLNPDTQLIVI